MDDSHALLPGQTEHRLQESNDALELQVQERTAALRESETALRESEIWRAAQKEAFQAAINGSPLAVSLGILAQTAIAHWGHNTRCGFYIADAERAELHHVTGMSESYAECVDGFKIGPDSLACGLAVYTGQPVITVDVTKDPAWNPWLWLADRYGFRGCWSFPIESVTGTVVGTFAVYFESPHTATPRDYAAAGLVTRTAAIIVSRNQEAEERARAVESLRASEAALRRALAERDALLKELHHRVKNNLQVIMSLLEMQAERATHPQALSSLSEARNRIGAIASMHELLHRSESVSEIDLARYARQLAEHVVSFYEKNARVRVTVEGDRISVDLARAVPIGLLLNELVSNACKHAFADDAKGELKISLNDTGGEIQIQVKDTGQGLPSELNNRTPATLGLQLVQMLAAQVGGDVSFECSGGTAVNLRMPSQRQMSGAPASISRQ